MKAYYLDYISKKLSIAAKNILAAIELLSQGNTVPFIARYRKEATGSLDEVEIKRIIDENSQLTKLSERKMAVLSKIEASGKLTEALKSQILAAEKLAEVEDLYLPYKEKRRTKATIAKENGLFPLAQLIVKNTAHLEKEAEAFVTDQVVSVDKAIEGAIDILAEAISEDARLRSWLTGEIKQNSLLTSHLDRKSVV